MTSSSPAICSVNQDGSVSYLAAGTCSLISHVAATQTTIGSGLSSAFGVAVDASGNVYVADWGSNQVVEVAPDGTQTTIGSGFSNPRGVAVDATGNVYVADNNRVVKVVPAVDGAVQSFVVQPTLSNISSSGTIGGGFTPVVSEGTSTGTTSVTSATPSICSVNQDGSVSYLAAGTCSLISHVAATQTTIGSGFSLPLGVSVDAAGNVYVADWGNNRVVAVDGAGTQTTIGSGFSGPAGVVVDASGNVYVADYGNNQVVKVAAAIDGASQSFSVVAGKPRAPSHIKAKANGASVTISWHAPSSNGGSSITKYQAKASPGGKSCTTSGLSCKISGLDPTKKYTVAVKAKNASGYGPAGTKRNVKG